MHTYTRKMATNYNTHLRKPWIVIVLCIVVHSKVCPAINGCEKNKKEKVYSAENLGETVSVKVKTCNSLMVWWWLWIDVTRTQSGQNMGTVGVS